MMLKLSLVHRGTTIPECQGSVSRGASGLGRHHGVVTGPECHISSSSSSSTDIGIGTGTGTGASAGVGKNGAASTSNTRILLV